MEAAGQKDDERWHRTFESLDRVNLRLEEVDKVQKQLVDQADRAELEAKQAAAERDLLTRQLAKTTQMVGRLQLEVLASGFGSSSKFDGRENSRSRSRRRESSDRGVARSRRRRVHNGHDHRGDSVDGSSKEEDFRLPLFDSKPFYDDYDDDIPKLSSMSLFDSEPIYDSYDDFFVTTKPKSSDASPCTFPDSISEEPSSAATPTNSSIPVFDSRRFSLCCRGTLGDSARAPAVGALLRPGVTPFRSGADLLIPEGPHPLQHRDSWAAGARQHPQGEHVSIPAWLHQERAYNSVAGGARLPEQTRGYIGSKRVSPSAGKCNKVASGVNSWELPQQQQLVVQADLATARRAPEPPPRRPVECRRAEGNCQPNPACHTLHKMNFPTFSGEDPVIWLDKCFDYFCTYNISKCLWVIAATMHMEGDVRHWWQMYKLQYGICSWSQLVCAVKDKFGTHEGRQARIETFSVQAEKHISSAVVSAIVAVSSDINFNMPGNSSMKCFLGAVASMAAAGVYDVCEDLVFGLLYAAVTFAATHTMPSSVDNNTLTKYSLIDIGIVSGPGDVTAPFLLVVGVPTDLPALVVTSEISLKCSANIRLGAASSAKCLMICFIRNSSSMLHDSLVSDGNFVTGHGRWLWDPGNHPFHQGSLSLEKEDVDWSGKEVLSVSALQIDKWVKGSEVWNFVLMDQNNVEEGMSCHGAVETVLHSFSTPTELPPARPFDHHFYFLVQNRALVQEEALQSSVHRVSELIYHRTVLKTALPLDKPQDSSCAPRKIANYSGVSDERKWSSLKKPPCLAILNGPPLT